MSDVDDPGHTCDSSSGLWPPVAQLSALAGGTSAGVMQYYLRISW